MMDKSVRDLYKALLNKPEQVEVKMNMLRFVCPLLHNINEWSKPQKGVKVDSITKMYDNFIQSRKCNICNKIEVRLLEDK